MDYKLHLNKKAQTSEIGLLILALAFLIIGITTLVTSNANSTTLIVGAVFLIVGIAALAGFIAQLKKS